MVKFLLGMLIGSILTVIILGFSAIAIDDEEQEQERQEKR